MSGALLTRLHLLSNGFGTVANRLLLHTNSWRHTLHTLLCNSRSTTPALERRGRAITAATGSADGGLANLLALLAAVRGFLIGLLKTQGYLLWVKKRGSPQDNMLIRCVNRTYNHHKLPSYFIWISIKISQNFGGRAGYYLLKKLSELAPHHHLRLFAQGCRE